MRPDARGDRARGERGAPTSALIALALFTGAPAQASPTDDAAHGLRCIPSHLEPVWTDRGSGAREDVAFVRTARGFFLGDFVVVRHRTPWGNFAPYDVLDHRGRLNPQCGWIPDGPHGRDALRRAVDFRRIWTDKGSGARQDGALWRPICERGFVALGDVATHGYRKPSVRNSRFRCVNAKLVKRTGHDHAWSDRGSGADRDVRVWKHTGFETRHTNGYARWLFIAEPHHGRSRKPRYQLKQRPAPDGQRRYDPRWGYGRN